jgi:hypothetical protein
MAMTQLDTNIEVDPTLSRQPEANIDNRTPDQYAADVICKWLYYVHWEIDPDEDSLGAMYVLNNPDLPRDTERHAALAQALGIRVPEPSEAPLPFQQEELAYDLSPFGRVKRQTFYLGDEGKRDFVHNSNKGPVTVIKGLPHGAFVVHYSVERFPADPEALGWPRRRHSK